MFGCQFGVVFFFTVTYTICYLIPQSSILLPQIVLAYRAITFYDFRMVVVALIDLLDNCPINPFRGSVFYPDICTWYVLVVRYFNERFIPANPIRI